MVLLPCASAVSLDPESSASPQQMVEREECCLGLGVICITSTHSQQAGTGPHHTSHNPHPHQPQGGLGGIVPSGKILPSYHSL